MESLRIWGIFGVFCLLLASCQLKAQKESTAVDEILNQVDRQDSHKFAVNKSEEQWRKQLSPAQYQILRDAGTEPRFSSPLLAVNAAGQMVCAACGNPLFDTKHKFKSTCGWPTFDQAIDGAVV